MRSSRTPESLPPRATDLHGTDSFHLEIDGISRGSFVRCHGLEAAVEVFAYAEGGATELRRFRGDRIFAPLVLERGLSQDRSLHEWFLNGDPRDGAVVLLARAGTESARWGFRRGWPVRWEGPILDAGSGAVALERLEIVHEGLQWMEP